MYRKTCKDGLPAGNRKRNNLKLQIHWILCLKVVRNAIITFFSFCSKIISDSVIINDAWRC